MGSVEWGVWNGECGMGSAEWGVWNGECGMGSVEWGVWNGEWIQPLLPLILTDFSVECCQV